MERTSIISGKIPAIIVAPHGYDGDDKNTAFIAEAIANCIDAYAVINRGWKRIENDQKVDFLLDKADCNNVNHCVQDVVREEFLDPIRRYKNKILKTNAEAFIFYIHGMGNHQKQIYNNSKLDMVIGFGEGNPSSYSCNLDRKDRFFSGLTDRGINAQNGANGALSGWSKQNMNQFFRKIDLDGRVNSLQIEIIYDLRKTLGKSLETAHDIAHAVLKCVNY